jgi:rare lipoprotein A
MAVPVFAIQGALKRWVAASVLIILAGCTTPPVLPEPPDASSALSSLDPSALTPPAPAATPPPKSRLADFMVKRFRKQIETPVPVVEPEVQAASEASEAPVDEKYQFTGEEARELERGHASWYGGKFHGRRTANGETYDKYALTAAHKTLPFGTIVRVRSLKLGREVDVRINDRGPFSPGRVIDVSQAAAEVLGLLGAGVAEVSLKVDDALDDVAYPAARNKKVRKVQRRTRRAPAVRSR